MQRLFWSVLIVFLFAQNVFAQSVQVMSWNIRYNTASDGVNAWPNRKDWVAEIIIQNKVELAGFQEVLVGQLEDLKARLPEMEAYSVGRDDGKNGGESCPIFYRKDRFELLEKSTFWLSHRPDKVASKGWDAALPRIASWVKLKDRKTNITFCFINTHFDHRGQEARAESAKLLLTTAKEKFAGLPVILAGDFNTNPSSVPYNTLIAKDAKEAPVFFDTYEHSAKKPEGPNSTWNGFKEVTPNNRIDFIFTTRSVKPLRLQILVDQKEGRFPSDHLPVVTELEVAVK